MSPAMAVSPDPVVVDENDRQVLESVDGYLRDGLTLKAWYDKAFAAGDFAEQFDLARTQNRPDRSFGFFDKIELNGQTKPIMGNYQEMFYDQPGVMVDFTNRKQEWRDQVREFVLHYFMRISSFSEPTPYISSGYPDPEAYIGGVSWCDPAVAQKEGFGFSQLYCKSRETGEILKFADHERYSILNLTEVAARYEWLVLQVKILDFAFTLQPLGQGAPDVGLNLNESSYLVLSPEYVINDENPGGDLLARYGFGYSFIRNPTPGITAYGPGEFDAAFESIEFDIDQKGRITVRMAFVSNRPEQVTKVNVNPLEWGYAIANAASLGWVGRVLPGVKEALQPFRLGSFDPVYTYVWLANLVTAGQAADMLCISREQLDKRFLLQHFTQHYQTLSGSLTTWRQIPNWLDHAALPKWVVTGGLINA